MSDLTVLIVNYNGGELLGRCLASLERDPTTAVSPVLVVDNASTDGSVEQARSHPRARVIELGENRGFGAANNVGLAACETPFVLMANPDTEMYAGSVADALGAMERTPAMGLVGPRLLSSDGSLQLSARNFPTVLREAFELLFLHRAFPVLGEPLCLSVQHPKAYDSGRRADWVSGAAMLARLEAMREVGGFDEGFFLYAEEIDLCRRLHDAGWDVRYDPALTMLHVGGAYSVQRDLAVENQRSKLRYFLKHEGRLRMLAFAAVTALRLSVRAALWALAGLRSADDPLRQRARAAVATLRAFPGLTGTFMRMARPPAYTGHLSPGRETA